MSTENPTAGTAGSTDDPEVVQQKIEQTRDELGDTVEALAAKADVKARIRDRAARLRGNAQVARTRAAETWRERRPSVDVPRGRPVIAAGAASAAASAAALLLVMRRRAARRSRHPLTRLRRRR